MKSIKSVLLVEDSAGDARLLREMFNEQEAHNSELTHVTCMGDAERHLSEKPVDLVLLDLGLPDAQGLDAIRRAHAAAPRIPLVVLTGLDDELMASQALQEGAQDYLIKGQIDTRGLLRAMRYASERKRLEHLKDEFVSTVSHELRTPLTSIAGALGLLLGKAGGNLPDAATRLLTIAHANSQRLVRLVNDILDIEKMEAKRIVYKFRRVDTLAMVKRTMEDNRGFADGYAVRIRLDDGGDVGDVRADPDRLNQLVTNLISNAVKFSHSGSEVVVKIEKEGETVRISVRDHGPGIADSFKSHIFERFAQADATNTRQKGGSGLGLSIAKQIADRLGGELGFADAPGGGTIFYFELPCWELGDSLAVDLAPQPDALRILLCEDSLEVAIETREQLRQVGYATDFAYTLADAISRVATRCYRAVLVDLQLPDGDGINLILRLRETPHYRDAAIVVVSANPIRGRDDPRSANLNVLDWLAKPLDVDRLIQALAEPVVDDAKKLLDLLATSNPAPVGPDAARAIANAAVPRIVA